MQSFRGELLPNTHKELFDLVSKPLTTANVAAFFDSLPVGYAVKPDTFMGVNRPDLVPIRSQSHMYLSKRMQDMLKALKGKRKAHWTMRGFWTVPGNENPFHSATVFKLMFNDLLEWVPNARFARLTESGEALAKSLCALKAYP